MGSRAQGSWRWASGSETSERLQWTVWVEVAGGRALRRQASVSVRWVAQPPLRLSVLSAVSLQEAERGQEEAVVECAAERAVVPSRESERV